jgi:hypothetical protein
MTEIQEVHMDSAITCYMLMKLNSDGNLAELKPTYGTHKILGGFWGSLEECKHEQMLQALKGSMYRLFKIDWKV